MKITTCNLDRFRNIKSTRLRFSRSRVFFVGENGQGKSNLLEALGLLHAFRSFRTSDLRNLIQADEVTSRLYFEIENQTAQTETILLQINRSGGRDAQINGEPCSTLADFLSRFPSVVFGSDDIQLIRGSPSGRRRLLDLHFASTQTGYLESLREYTRGIAARNRLLKNKSDDREIKAFDIPLARAAFSLHQHRKRGVSRLSPLFRNTFLQISGMQEDPMLRLNHSFSFSSPEILQEKWNSSLHRDRLLGATQTGPHRDDWGFFSNGAVARDFSSDGQQRNFAIALKLSFLQDLQSVEGNFPILLVDDVLGELDSRRRKAFWSAIPSECQLFATGTEFIPPSDSELWEIFKVEGGKFIRS
ncbi:MAG: DNA replication and repair protein RecF [Verrucomicrobiota bacterium]